MNWLKKRAISEVPEYRALSRRAARFSGAARKSLIDEH